MEFQGKYSVIENRSSYQNSWKNLQKHQELQDNCQQHIILRLMDRQRGLIKKQEHSYNITSTTNKIIRQNGQLLQNSSIMTKDIWQQAGHLLNLILEDIHERVILWYKQSFRDQKNSSQAYKVYGGSIRNNKEVV